MYKHIKASGSSYRVEDHELDVHIQFLKSSGHGHGLGTECDVTARLEGLLLRDSPRSCPQIRDLTTLFYGKSPGLLRSDTAPRPS